MNDPVVDELKDYRERYAAEFDFDLDAIFRDLRAKEQASDRKIVSFSTPRTPNAESPARKESA